MIKWGKRQSVEDLPWVRRSGTVRCCRRWKGRVVALRVQARLPLDDVYIALKNEIPHLTRSAARSAWRGLAIATASNSDPAFHSGQAADGTRLRPKWPMKSTC